MRRLTASSAVTRLASSVSRAAAASAAAASAASSRSAAAALCRARGGCIGRRKAPVCAAVQAAFADDADMTIILMRMWSALALLVTLPHMLCLENGVEREYSVQARNRCPSDGCRRVCAPRPPARSAFVPRSVPGGAAALPPCGPLLRAALAPPGAPAAPRPTAAARMRRPPLFDLRGGAPRPTAAARMRRPPWFDLRGGMC